MNPLSNDQKILNLLGLATRARAVVFGEDQILKAIRSKEAKLVLLALDIGINTKKSLTDKSAHYGVPCVTFVEEALLSQAVGKSRRVAVAITDQGFAKKMLSLLD